MPPIKVQGGTLPWVLAISLIMATLAMLLIMQSGLRARLAVDYGWQRLVYRNADSGLAFLSAGFDDYEWHQTKPIILPGPALDTVWVTKHAWGLWPYAKAVASKGRFSAIRIQQLGFKPDTLGEAALYLGDTRRPMAVSGDNTIRGTAYVPPAGIRTAFINREGYRKATYVEGDQRVSKGSLSTVNMDVYQAFRQQRDIWPSLRPQQQDSLLQQDSVVWSFQAKSPLVLDIQGTLRLQGFWSGFIIIRATEGIVLGPNCRLQHVILEAPYISSQKGFSGQAQWFVTDSARLKTESQLSYPSAILLENPAQGAQVVLEPKSGMAGTLVLPTPPTEKPVRARLMPEATLVGQLYWADEVELQKAKVYGHVSCQNFYLRIGGSTWQNTLYGATLDAKARPGTYLAPPLWGYRRKPVPILDLP